jgi:hypothetical protein
LPTFPPAITAVVNPAKTRTNVPNNSAAYFMRLSPQGKSCSYLDRATHVSRPGIFTADSFRKIALKSKREFYMAEVVFARICAGALPLSELAGASTRYPRV